ncbi:hypothetical protein KSS87_004418 [Heliosperma pusillum]|nr:hypothetical protein KSS87_004418 [Heliosperma pusillum]
MRTVEGCEWWRHGGGVRGGWLEEGGCKRWLCGKKRVAGGCRRWWCGRRTAEVGARGGLERRVGGGVVVVADGGGGGRRKEKEDVAEGGGQVEARVVEAGVWWRRSGGGGLVEAGEAEADRRRRRRPLTGGGTVVAFCDFNLSFARIQPTTADEADELYSDEVGVTETVDCGGLTNRCRRSSIDGGANFDQKAGASR